jgi:predicted adenylyl cyclase CyaB
MQNIEQKFRCPDLVEVERRARAMGAADRGLIFQHDLFFSAPLARLKLRLFPKVEGDLSLTGPAELISYARADEIKARASNYHIARIEDPNSLIATLTQALGPAQSLRKTRHLFIWENTRIHLDEVNDLGTFVELETVVSQQSVREAREELESVAHTLALHEPVATAYVDLLTHGEESGHQTEK